ncbi:MAG: alpha/beta fold hydrolase [Gammaproteobacteria bacterium]|nr:alpha/beta fold hydrolase [Gammaproteobacteria bacterium]
MSETADVQRCTFRIASADGVELAVHHYHSGRGAARGTVILVHGLLATSEIFDVPGGKCFSLARALAEGGFHVVTYDQRGAGDSTAGSPDFGLFEHALVDLPAVIEFAVHLDAHAPGPIVLGGHSLGGLLIYLQQIAARRLDEQRVGPWVQSIFTIAGPASFDTAWSPWNLIARGGHDLVRRLDPDSDGMVTRAEFVAGQTQLCWPVLGRLVRPAAVGFVIRLGCAFPLLAPLLLHAPLPTFIYGRKDFAPKCFAEILRSRVLDAASRQILDELVVATRSGGRLTLDAFGTPLSIPDDLPTLRGIRLLTVTSAGDALVPFQSVQEAHKWLPGRSVLTEQAYGIDSGHAGYLFRPGLCDRVAQDILAFCAATGNAPD